MCILSYPPDRIVNILLPLYYGIVFFSFFAILNKIPSRGIYSPTLIFQMLMFVYHITLVIVVKMEYKSFKGLRWLLSVTKFIMIFGLISSTLTKKNEGRYDTKDILLFCSSFLIFCSYVWMVIISINKTTID